LLYPIRPQEIPLYLAYQVPKIATPPQEYAWQFGDLTHHNDTQTKPSLPIFDRQTWLENYSGRCCRTSCWWKTRNNGGTNEEHQHGRKAIYCIYFLIQIYL
jgi:hypothetical protein